MIFGKKKAKQKEAEEAEKKAQEEAKAKEAAAPKPAPVPVSVFSQRIAGVFSKMYRLVLSVSLGANIVQVESGDRIVLGKEIPVRLYFDQLVNFVGECVIEDQKKTFAEDFGREKLYRELCGSARAFTGYYCVIKKKVEESGSEEADAPKEDGGVLDESESNVEFICLEIRAEMIPGPNNSNSDRCIIFVRLLEKLPENVKYRTDAELGAENTLPAEIDWEAERLKLFVSGEPAYAEFNVKTDEMLVHGPDGDKLLKNYRRSIDSRSDFTIFHNDVSKMSKLLDKAVSGQHAEDFLRYRMSASSANKFRIHRFQANPVGNTAAPEWIVIAITDVDEEYRDKNNRNAIAVEIEKMMSDGNMTIYEIDTTKDLIYKITRDEIGFTRSGEGSSFSGYVRQRLAGDVIDPAYKANYEKWLVPDYLEKMTARKSFEFESLLKLPGTMEYRCYRETLSKLNGINHYLRIRRDVNDQYNSRRSEYQMEELNRYIEYNQGMLDTMASLVEFRNVEAGPHIHKVREITRMLLEDVAKRSPVYELTPAKIDLYVEAATTHDIGKIVIPDSILNKPGRLTDEEYAVMKTHTTAGSKIVEKLTLPGQDELLKVCKDVALHHHERYDGSGYPEGLSGDNINIGVQCVSVADVFDAMLSERCYKGSISIEETTDDFLVKNRHLWNPRVLESFKACLGSMTKFYIE